MITTMFYPDSITDDFDVNTLNIEKTLEKQWFDNICKTMLASSWLKVGQVGTK